jgi:hypothetical protein
VEILPTLLGTYGDHGNLMVLADRTRARGIPVEAIATAPGDPVPADADIYLLGGGEDTAQTVAAQRLSEDKGVAAVLAERAVLAVCAGFQLMGATFPGVDGQPVRGLGIIDAHTVPGRPRAVGEVVADPDEATGLDTLTGFENHGGRTVLGAAARPLGRVVKGLGNGDGGDGVIAGHLVGTYLHGPVLARNPGLADLLLTWAVGPIPPLDRPHVDALRAERMRYALTGGGRVGVGWRSHLRRAR